MASTIKPFQIAVPDAALATLQQKLAAATFPQDVTFSDSWDYGVPLSDLKRLASYWQTGYDWRKAEARLNATLPQFTTSIAVDGFGALDVHFVHQQATTTTRAPAIPLLFCHGWPGSFLEVVKILPLLTNPTTAGVPAFHVVAPSLPNFGFSGAVPTQGFTPAHHAEVCHKLMLALGYDRYVTQGGDWGYIITRLMAIRYPAHVLATHINFVRVVAPPTFTGAPLVQFLKHAVLPYSAHEKAGLARTVWFQKKGFGYNLEQSTRPHTLGFALADSPLALLAWVYEKLHDWTDDYPWTDDEVLTWISIYAFSTAGADASVRIYYENHNRLGYAAGGAYVPNIPLGLSYFPKDLVVPPSTWGRTLGPVAFERRHEDGGHFAAYERPETLCDDLRTMFGKNGGAAGVVKKLKAQARI